MSNELRCSETKALESEKKRKGRRDTLASRGGGGARAVSATSLWKGQYLPESAEKPEMY